MNQPRTACFRTVGWIILLAMCLAFPQEEESDRKRAPWTRANPNFPTTRFEWGDAAALSVAQAFEVQRYFISGLMEIRNEPRFDEKVLPNHSWRGFLQAGWASGIIDLDSAEWLLISGLEHESAHATMGIVETTDDPYQMIYDTTYRTCMLNAVFVAPFFRWRGTSLLLEAKPEVFFYGFSKNTPELPGKKLGEGLGHGAGVEAIFPRKSRLRAFASAYERSILTGTEKARDSIYVRRNGSLEKVEKDYPILRETFTFQAKAGLLWDLRRWGQTLEIFGKYHHGIIYGYMDSRDSRDILAVGVGISGKF